MSLLEVGENSNSEIKTHVTLLSSLRLCKQTQKSTNKVKLLVLPDVKQGNLWLGYLGNEDACGCLWLQLQTLYHLYHVPNTVLK